MASGFRDLFALTMRWHSSTTLVAMPSLTRHPVRRTSTSSATPLRRTKNATQRVRRPSEN